MSLKLCFRRDDGSLNSLGFIGMGVILVGLLPIAFVVAFEAFWIYDLRVNEPKAALAQTNLENEFRIIRPLPAATALNYHASHKTQQALVSGTYRTSLAYEDIRKFYDAELAKNGWSFYMEEQMRDWGRDLGGKTARYCKEQYRANLQYSGEKSNYGWDYAFSVSWGLDAIFESYPEPFHRAGCK